MFHFHLPKSVLQHSRNLKFVAVAKIYSDVLHSLWHSDKFIHVVWLSKPHLSHCIPTHTCLPFPTASPCRRKRFTLKACTVAQATINHPTKLLQRQFTITPIWNTPYTQGGNHLEAFVSCLTLASCLNCLQSQHSVACLLTIAIGTNRHRTELVVHVIQVEKYSKPGS